MGFWFVAYFLVGVINSVVHYIHSGVVVYFGLFCDFVCICGFYCVFGG